MTLINKWEKHRPGNGGYGTGAGLPLTWADICRTIGAVYHLDPLYDVWERWSPRQLCEHYPDAVRRQRRDWLLLQGLIFKQKASRNRTGLGLMILSLRGGATVPRPISKTEDPRELLAEIKRSKGLRKQRGRRKGIVSTNRSPSCPEGICREKRLRSVPVLDETKACQYGKLVSSIESVGRSATLLAGSAMAAPVAPGYFCSGCRASLSNCRAKLESTLGSSSESRPEGLRAPLNTQRPPL